MHTTAETFCPQLFIVKDNEAMRYSNETTKYDKKDGVYKAPNYLESRFKRFAGVVKKVLAPTLIIVGFGALIIASMAADASMNGVWYG